MINKKIVMILEDDIDLAEGIELSLKDEKLNFIICNTIAEARKALTLYSFDLLIFDINLPDGNGIEFCRELKKEMQIPIALLTAKSMEMDIVKGPELGLCLDETQQQASRNIEILFSFFVLKQWNFIKMGYR